MPSLSSCLLSGFQHEARRRLFIYNTMKITPDKIESLPAHLESNYGSFRESIRETLTESLENGDAIKSLQSLVGDFMRALNHTLEEFDAPENTLNAVLSILD